MQESTAVAVVLAGGSSRRMGRNKALLEWNGRPLIEHIVLRLLPAFDEVVVVGGNPYRTSLPRVLWMSDDHPGAGAAAAIFTALRRLQRPCFICACDMPFVHAEFGRWLLESAPEAAAHVPRWQGQAQPLHAAWRPSAIPYLAPPSRRLEHVLHHLQKRGTLYWADDEVVRRFDAEGKCFVNLNTPSEWHYWLQAQAGG